MHYIINKSYRPDSSIPPKRIEITATDFYDAADGTRVFTNRATGEETRVPLVDIFEFESHA